MKESKKTMLVIAVTLLLAAALFVGAGAADGDTNNGEPAVEGDTVANTTSDSPYEKLVEAVASAEEGGVITITEDIDFNDKAAITIDKSITIQGEKIRQSNFSGLIIQ